MQNENQRTPEDLITLIRKDCHRQAESIQKKLAEVTECLHEENHLGALGGFAALDDDIVCLKCFSPASRHLRWAKQVGWSAGCTERNTGAEATKEVNRTSCNAP